MDMDPAYDLSFYSVDIKQTANLQNLCQDIPKLRTFVNFKQFGATPKHITMPMSFI